MGSRTRFDHRRRWLRLAVAVAGLVPVGAGIAGIVVGPALTQAPTVGSADGHYRYLSGLLLGIGLCFWSLVPAIETRTTQFRLLTIIVVVGGLGRLVGMVALGDDPAPVMVGALMMELVVTPLLCLWQWRAAGQAR